QIVLIDGYVWLEKSAWFGSSSLPIARWPRSCHRYSQDEVRRGGGRARNKTRQEQTTSVYQRGWTGRRTSSRACLFNPWAVPDTYAAQESRPLIARRKNNRSTRSCAGRVCGTKVF